MNTNPIAKKTLAIALVAILTGCGGSDSNTTTTPTTPTNQAPTANAGTDGNVDEQTSFSLAGTATDSDGSISSISWTQTAGPTVTINDADTLTPTFVAPDVNDDQLLTFILSVTDDDGSNTTDSVDITVKHINLLPSVTVDAPGQTNEQSSVSISSEVSDVEGEIAGYQWSQTAGTSVELINADSATVSFTTPTLLVTDGPQTLSFSLEVTDRHGGQANAVTELLVNPVNASPTIEPGDIAPALEEQSVTLAPVVSDSDGSVVSYLWQQIDNGEPLVELDSTNNNTVSFESPAIDADTTLQFVLAVIDNEGAQTTQTMDILIQDSIGISLDRFGQGEITVNNATFECQGNDCSKRFAKGQPIDLIASPADGWSFSHWNGCDTQTANTCTLNGESSTTAYVTFANNDAVVTTDDVRILSTDELELLTSVESTTLIFSPSASAMKTLPIGTILISQQDAGFARRITKIIALDNASVIIETADVSLQEIVKSGTLVYSQLLTTEKLTSMQLEPGVKYLKPNTQSAKANCGGNFCFSINSTFSDNVVLSGNAEFTLTPDIAYDFGITNFNSLRMVMHTQVKTGLALSVQGETELGKIEKEVPIGLLKFAPIPLGPVVIVPTVKLFVGIKGSAQGKLSFGVTPVFNGSVGARYHKSSGFKAVSSGRLSDTDAFATTMEAGFSLQTYAQLYTGFAVYDVIGPFIKTEPFLRGVATSNVDLQSGETCIDFGLYRGLRARFGGNIKVLSYELLKWEATLYNKSTRFAGQKEGFCEPDTVAPTAPTNLTVDAFDVTSATLSWTASEDLFTIDKYLVYRDSEIIGETNDTDYFDSELQPQTHYCYSVQAVDSAGNQSQMSDEACVTTLPEIDDIAPTVPTNVVVSPLSSRAMSVAWTASTDNTQVAGYIINRNDGVITSVTTTGFDSTSLQPETEYCYSVAAIDIYGNRSAFSPAVCNTTLTPDEATWLMRIKCDTASDYVVGQQLDLESDVNQNVSLVGSGNDYNGSPLAYVLRGEYAGDSQLLNGSITWTFENSSSTRKDTFSVDLSGDDTGDVTMTQVQVTGCTAQIRFSKNEELAKPFVPKQSDFDGGLLDKR